jgi:hypothetical protein
VARISSFSVVAGGLMFAFPLPNVITALVTRLQSREQLDRFYTNLKKPVESAEVVASDTL